METLPIKKSDELWDKLWINTKNEWFKVETLQDYTGEDRGKSLNDWFRGNKKQSIELIKNEMTKGPWIKDFQKAKFRKIRIHITTTPYSEYVMWELNHYRLINIPLCNEEVYLIEYNKLVDIDVPKGDFVIFDESKVIQNHYDETGKAYQVDFYDSEDDISKYLNLRKILLERAVRFCWN